MFTKTSHSSYKMGKIKRHAKPQRRSQVSIKTEENKLIEAIKTERHQKKLDVEAKLHILTPFVRDRRCSELIYGTSCPQCNDVSTIIRYVSSIGYHTSWGYLDAFEPTEPEKVQINKHPEILAYALYFERYKFAMRLIPCMERLDIPYKTRFNYKKPLSLVCQQGEPDIALILIRSVHPTTYTERISSLTASCLKEALAPHGVNMDPVMFALARRGATQHDLSYKQKQYIKNLQYIITVSITRAFGGTPIEMLLVQEIIYDYLNW